MLNVTRNEYFQSTNKTKHSALKESPEGYPRTRVEPATDSRRQLIDDMDVQILGPGYIDRVELSLRLASRAYIIDSTSDRFILTMRYINA